jgi:hypothetical protein
MRENAAGIMSGPMVDLQQPDHELHEALCDVVTARGWIVTHASDKQDVYSAERLGRPDGERVVRERGRLGECDRQLA